METTLNIKLLLHYSITNINNFEVLIKLYRDQLNYLIDGKYKLSTPLIHILSEKPYYEYGNSYENKVIKSIKLLLDEDIDINMKDMHNSTALSVSIDRNYSKSMVAMLIDSGAKISDLLFDEKYVKYFSDHFTNYLAKVLIESGAKNLSINDKTILYFCDKLNIEICDNLIKLGVDINSRDDNGNTFLHYKINNKYYGDLVNINYYINKGFDPNITNNDGNTILHLLCKNYFTFNNNKSLIETAIGEIKNNTNFQIRNNKNQTIVDILMIMFSAELEKKEKEKEKMDNIVTNNFNNIFHILAKEQYDSNKSINIKSSHTSNHNLESSE